MEFCSDCITSKRQADVFDRKTYICYIQFSRYYLCYIFRRQTGIAVFQYLLELRVAKAKRLLSHSHDTVSHIAEQVGFNHTNYFNRVFRMSVGCTPSEYRVRS